MKLTKELKAAWVKALRSRKYKQGQGALRRTDFNGCTTHCCLGVLKDIAPPEFASKVISGSLLIDGNGDDVLLPFPKQQQLAKMNDDKKSFRFIAGYIEKSRTI